MKTREEELAGNSSQETFCSEEWNNGLYLPGKQIIYARTNAPTWTLTLKDAESCNSLIL